jgi:hypothetical protein
MFLYSLSSRLDRIDPYWYARLIGLKAAYLATGLFIANLILKPASPSVTMLMSAVGILIAEMPAINTPDKKDKIYLEYDGSGHSLSIKFGRTSEQEFYEKENKRKHSPGTPKVPTPRAMANPVRAGELPGTTSYIFSST